MENEILLSKKMTNLWGQPTDIDVQVRVKNLLNGDWYKCKDLGETISYAESLKSACATLKTYLEVARGFGGQEVIDF